MFVNIVIHSGQAIGLLDAIITFISSFCDFMEGRTVETKTGRDERHGVVQGNYPGRTQACGSPWTCIPTHGGVPQYAKPHHPLLLLVLKRHFKASSVSG